MVNDMVGKLRFERGRHLFGEFGHGGEESWAWLERSVILPMLTCDHMCEALSTQQALREVSHLPIPQ